MVAGEVKQLARQTAAATEGITRRIAAIQADSAGAADAITQIGVVIRDISEHQTTIAAAVEEQTVTTNELSRRVAEVASSAALIEDNARVLGEAAGDTTDGATSTEQAAGRVASSAHDLRELLEPFRY